MWKLKYDWAKGAEFKELLERFVKLDRLRITPWLVAEPSTLLESGHFVYAVHHGGANSYYGACK